MAKITMRLEGMDALKRATVECPEVLRAHSGDAVAATTFATESRMKATVRVKTGRLKRAIHRRSRGLSGSVLIAPDAFYWRFLEYGTVNMAASPFIRPSVEAEGPIYIQRMRAIGPKLERAWASGSGLL